MRNRLKKMYTIHKKVLSALDKASEDYKITKSRIVENALIDYLRIEVKDDKNNDDN